MSSTFSGPPSLLPPHPPPSASSQRVPAPADVAARLRALDRPAFYDESSGIFFDGHDAWLYPALGEAGLSTCFENLDTAIDTAAVGNGTEGNLEVRPPPSKKFCRSTATTRRRSTSSRRSRPPSPPPSEPPTTSPTPIPIKPLLQPFTWRCHSNNESWRPLFDPLCQRGVVLFKI